MPGIWTSRGSFSTARPGWVNADDECHQYRSLRRADRLGRLGGRSPQQGEEHNNDHQLNDPANDQRRDVADETPDNQPDSHGRKETANRQLNLEPCIAKRSIHHDASTVRWAV